MIFKQCFKRYIIKKNAAAIPPVVDGFYAQRILDNTCIIMMVGP